MATNSIAIGYNTQCTAPNSIALGVNSVATLGNQICLGTSNETVYLSNPVVSMIDNRFYLTTWDCGVYMWNGAAKAFNIYPIFVSIPNATNFFNAVNTSGSSFTAGYYNDIDGGAVGTFYTIDLDNADKIYLVMPYYGITMWDTINYTGTIRLNFFNNSAKPIMVQPSVANSFSSCKIYYNGTTLT